MDNYDLDKIIQEASSNYEVENNNLSQEEKDFIKESLEQMPNDKSFLQLIIKMCEEKENGKTR